MVEEVRLKYKDRVNVVGILVDAQFGDGAPDADTILLARYLMGDAGADFTNLLMSVNMITAVIGEISVVPTTFFVDSEGNMIGAKHAGGRTLSQWSGIIDEML